VKFLLDTCVISAFRKPQENPSLVEWISGVDESDLYLSAITIGELERGVSRLPESKKKAAVSEWVRHAVTNRFGNRILPIDAAVAACWGEMTGALEKQGKTLPILDALIAATAITADCTVVTRNIKDFADCGIRLLNP
jgi:predicted nucleic acid-binding protein